ncbi:MAG: triple tyrosine motif-containing protein, partial [Bacteroidia bacterium]|nr:triple tyrosine motif-containing protein [Bacteroidia bacterium]
HLLLSTDDGYSWIDTRQQSALKNTFKVFLDKIIVTNHAGKLLTENADLVKKFPYNQNSLRFELVAPEFRNERLVQYKFMLENFDKNWTESSPNNSKEYTRLPRGHYTFKVKAKDFLEPKEAVLSYSFDILPAWYESKLAMILYFILFVLILTRI